MPLEGNKLKIQPESVPLKEEPKGHPSNPQTEEQRNPFEGMQVQFVENENEKENADGVRGHLEVIGEEEYKPRFYEKYIKRALDIVLSAMGLILLSPVMGAVSLAIKIEDPGPVLFTQKRIGKNKKYFKLHKFRSMRLDTPHDIPTHQLENPEQYITKVGKFIREHSIDELPQIWDIFIGNMSVIGPRPGLWNQDLLIAERDKYDANNVKPGLTGLAQINGRDELEIVDKAKLDGQYVADIGFLMDAKIFLGTLHVFGKDNSIVEGGIGNKRAKQSDSKKKILVICQYYKPEPFRIADICEEMARRGHEVQVVTGYPNYPEGILYDGYGKGKRTDEVINGVKVHRCYTVPRKRGFIRRILNYYSYAISSVKYVRSRACKSSDGKPFDVVFCNQLSPVMMANAAIAYQKKHRTPVVMYCLDLWPESLIAGGIARGSMVYRYFHHVSKKIYGRMDKILITSRLFSGYLENEFGINPGKIEHLPQYAEGVFEKLPSKEVKEVCDMMFAGNIGSVQSIETIIGAAKLLKDAPVRFHIVGGGTELDRLQRIAEGLTNVVFYGRRPLEDMPEYYAKADAMLVTLTADPILSLTLPGKVQSYMAAGKPIIGAIDGETNKVIEEAGCGFCGKAEDIGELADNIRKFLQSNDKTVMGINAIKYYEEHYQKSLFMDKLEKYLNQEQ